MMHTLIGKMPFLLLEAVGIIRDKILSVIEEALSIKFAFLGDLDHN